jgi:hypothetical protein
MEIPLSGLESDVNMGIVAFRLSPPLERRSDVLLKRRERI